MSTKNLLGKGPDVDTAYVDAADALKLDLTGGSMTGDVVFDNTNDVTGIQNLEATFINGVTTVTADNFAFTETNATALSFYRYDATSNYAFTGPVSVNVPLAFTRVGQLVNISWGTTSFTTTSAAALTTSSIPVNFRPSGDKYSDTVNSLGGTNYHGAVLVNASGNMTFYDNILGTPLSVFNITSDYIIYGGSITFVTGA